MIEPTFREFGLLRVQRGTRGACWGSGLPCSLRRPGAIVTCPRCHRSFRATTFRRVPTHKKRVLTRERKRRRKDLEAL